MGGWSGSLRKKGIRKRIIEDVRKESEKVSDMLNREIETRLRERVDVIEKIEGTFRKNSNPSRTRR
jgi:hypothetical protein